MQAKIATTGSQRRKIAGATRDVAPNGEGVRILVNPKPKQSKSVALVFEGRHKRIAALATTSFVGGLAEATFLVAITSTAFAITNGKDRVESLGGRSFSIGEMVWLSLALVVVRLALTLASTHQAARLSYSVVAHIRRELSQAFLRSSWSVQHEERSGRLQELLTTFAANGASLVGGVINSITAGFNLAAMVGLAVVVDPSGSVVVVVAVAVLGLVLRPIRARVRKRAEETSRGSMEFATALSEISSLGMEVHVFGVQPQAEARVSRLIDENAAMNERLMFLRGLLPALYSGLAYLAIVGALGFVAAADKSNLAALGSVMLLMMRSLSYGQALQTSAATLAASLPFVEAMNDQLAVYRGGRVIDQGGEVRSVGPLTLKSVSFHYADGQPVLSDVNAEIPPKEIVGIVGPSGSGKSTLVQLMLGLRSPTSGQVLSDGRDIHTLSRAEWARKVTFVPQAPRLIAGTVAANIRFLRDDVSDADIEAASRLAHLHDDVVGWPEGYSRDVGEAGGHLSGGQQQRLCIARALVENPDVLILDEPTSSLDVRSESLIRETLSELSKKMTVIVIAHRMSTLEICDRIMVIQDGQLKAFDTPANLEKSSDFYREALVLSGLR